MNTRMIALAVAPLAALALTAGPALAGGSGGKLKAPTAAQKAAIMKAGGFKGPARCYTIHLSASKTTLAGARFNTKAANCTKYAFNGAGLYYGTSSKKTWYLLSAGSALGADKCDALQALAGGAAWEDLTPYVTTLGCQNID